MRRIAFLSFACAVVFATTAAAQSPTADTRARELNRRALEAYGELSFDDARAALEQALTLCQQSTCSPGEVARTYVNLGVVTMGATSDAARTQQLFEQALRTDPSVQLDPMHSTPELAQIFARAHGRESVVASTGATSENVLGLVHTPVEEQLVHTAVPVYVEIPNGVNVPRMVVRYRGNGMRAFREIAMQPLLEGFGVEIPCADVLESSLAYYVVALGGGARVLGTVGSEQRPFTVRIVRTRRFAPPALPGRAPPETCAAAECPPGRPNCHDQAPAGPVGLGGSCNADSGCESGLTCRDGLCGAAEAPRETRRFFVQVGASLAMASAHGGMTAASTPQVDPADPNPQTDSIAANDSFYLNGNNGCDPSSGQYCVRVTDAGTAFAWGLDVNAGAWISERFGLALHARVAPQAGSGSMSHFLLGGRVLYRVIVPRPDGFHLSLFVGGGGGQIQVRPKQEPTPPATSVDRPWVRTGLGSIELGATLGYFFTPTVGIYATPSLYALFPDTSFGLQVAVGLELQFGKVGGAPAPTPVATPAPAAPRDADHDGILDPQDQCPNAAEDRDQFEDADGCPDPDNDSDGVLDAQDRCPREPEDRDGFEDADGCPDLDNDADGVADTADRCPNEAGPTSNNGCPEPDRDADGTADRIDNCPDEPGPPENHGCAQQQLVLIQEGRLEILEKIYFRTNSHVIERRSYPLLDNVARVLLAHPEIDVVHIEGHTDARGDARRNRALSQRRANSVMQYLVRKGHVPAARLTARGFGPDRPIYPNATSEDENEANRRVEFRIGGE